MKKKAKIYALKEHNKIRYIGKTITGNKEGVIIKSDLNVIYQNDKLRNIAVNNDNIDIDILEEVPFNNWFDPKLKQIVDHHKDKENKLLNAQHFLDGRRGFFKKGEGFWVGKYKDQYTINRLNESKHVTVIQYNKNGLFVKEWKSIKDICINIFNDYKVINGGSKSEIYDILSQKYINKRLKLGSYWIRKNEFTGFKIPKKINVDAILTYQKEKTKRKTSELREKNKHRYKKINNNKGIYQMDSDHKIIKQFPSAIIAGKELNVHASTINKCCRYIRTHVGEYTFMFKLKKHRKKYYHNL